MAPPLSRRRRQRLVPLERVAQLAGGRARDGDTLAKTGCVDQNVAADQAETSYTCSASSLGGSAGPVSRSIKRDATPPTVTMIDGPAHGASYYQDYDVPAAPTCGATDTTSGVKLLLGERLRRPRRYLDGVDFRHRPRR